MQPSKGSRGESPSRNHRSPTSEIPDTQAILNVENQLMLAIRMASLRQFAAENVYARILRIASLAGWVAALDRT